jgi:uncharacterized membrane protein
MWILVGLALYLWQWIVGAVILVVVAVLVYHAVQVVRAANAERRAQRAAIIARADQQQAWRLAGDPRGWYGDYPPATR